MINLRKADYSDIDLLYNWANDPIVRRFSFNSDPIPYDDHKKWFNKMMEDSNVIQFILEDETIPVGQIRLNIIGEEAEISYSIVREYRGKGLGHKMLQLTQELIKERYPGITTLKAKVKQENTVSKMLFEKENYNIEYVCFTLDLNKE